MRESGILMHITSLPGPYGVGTMGKHAYAFVDFLKEAGQSCWQILPLTPTGYGDSPYQSCSTFAGNYYLIDLDTLIEEGLLKKSEVEGIQWCRREDKADFGLLYNNRLKVLRLAYDRFDGGKEFEAFCAENRDWLEDFALFMALKTQNNGKPWYQWEDDLKFRDVDAIDDARVALAEEIRFHSFVQYLFRKQWFALRDYAHENGVKIIGDVPIYVPLDSADVWTNPELFQLDEELDPIDVAGCPPDCFSEDGQLWGNPLYAWERHAKTDFAWWTRRMAAAGKLYDIVRLDHFRGFEAYWAVPYGDKTARNGKWVKGPAMDFVNALKRELPDLKVIAEDLGFLTQEVLDMLAGSGYPGMKVLQFGFDAKAPSDYVPYNHVPNSVCYTSTHDSHTALQWLRETDADTLAYATEYMGLNEQEGLAWGIIRTAMASVSNLCMAQIQDYLEIGEEGRMNCPGILSDCNWTWRAKCGTMTSVLAKRIHRLTVVYGRNATQYATLRETPKEKECETQNINLGE